MSGDTIAAISTAPGAGGIAIVRLSGPRAEELLRAVFRPASERADLSGRRLTYGAAVDGRGEVLDEVMAVLLRAPRTYTRENMAEVHCHGGGACASAVLARFLALGARAAEPGEFTRRAYENLSLIHIFMQARKIVSLLGRFIGIPPRKGRRRPRR